MEQVTLSYPINVGGTEQTIIKLRRPKVRDVRAAEKHSKDGFEQVLYLISKVGLLSDDSGLSPADVDEIDVVDITKISEVIEGFTKG